MTTKTKTTKTVPRPTKAKTARAPKTKTARPEGEPRTEPIMLRMTPADLADLDELADELQRGAHPALDALAGSVITRSAVIRLCITRGKRVLREEMA